MAPRKQIKDQGHITPNSVVLNAHESATVVFLTSQGYDVELIPPSQQKGTKTPDILMNRMEWEMKSPKNAGKYTIEYAIETASKQSKNIIMDLRRCKMPQQKCISKIENELKHRRDIKNFLVITKSRKLVDMKKRY